MDTWKKLHVDLGAPGKNLRKTCSGVAVLVTTATYKPKELKLHFCLRLREKCLKNLRRTFGGVV